MRPRVRCVCVCVSFSLYIFPQCLLTASSSSSSLKKVCQSVMSKYTCPACSIHFCSLECSRSHKLQTRCTGKRDRTGHVELRDFTDKHLLSDYRFLEDAKSKTDMLRRMRWTDRIDSRMYQFHHKNTRRFQISARQQRNVHVQLMPEGMDRRSRNRSYFHRDTDTLFWTVGFLFEHTTSPDGFTITLDKVSEKETLWDILDKYLHPVHGDGVTRSILDKYTPYHRRPEPIPKQDDLPTASAEDLDKDVSIRDVSRPAATEMAASRSAHTASSARATSAANDNALKTDAIDLESFDNETDAEGVQQETKAPVDLGRDPERQGLHYEVLLPVDTALRPTSHMLFYRMDLNATLQRNLENKFVIEFPIFRVVLPSDVQYPGEDEDKRFKIITVAQQRELLEREEEESRLRKERKDRWKEKQEREERYREERADGNSDQQQQEVSKTDEQELCGDRATQTQRGRGMGRGRGYRGRGRGRGRGHRGRGGRAGYNRNNS